MAKRSFSRCTRGNVAVIFGLALLPILIFIGLAVDMGRAMLVRDRLGHALDAVALAVGSAPGLTEDEAQAFGERFFSANYPAARLGVPLDLNVALSEDVVDVTASARVPMTIMQIVGASELLVDRSVQVARAGDDLELVMVLDNTGSMSGSRIRALREAAGSAVEILFDAAPPGDDSLRIGLVPFSSAVNVGAENARAWWLDPDARSPLHAPASSFDRPVNRWDLFDDLREDWRGCVEARAQPYDIDDTTPQAGSPATLFVPYFAPDEPGGRGNPRSGYRNSYLADSTSGPNAVRQAHAAKYATGARPRNGGPNWGCTARPIVPLTDDRDTLDDAVDAMIADGTTNIHNAVGWGVRVLSPEAPFEEGRSFGERNLIKAMIVLTDGDNYIGADGTHNRSHYTSYGFVAEGRLGVTSSSFRQVNDAMNERTAEACRLARERGVRVYAITFQVRSSRTRRLMEACASTGEDGRPLYFDSPSNQALQQAFEDIARDLTLLRLSR